MIKIGEGVLKDPEDICVDEVGRIYAATRDGWIRRLHRNGSWENWKFINSHTLLGITPSMAGGILVCDTEEVLHLVLNMYYAITRNQVTVNAYSKVFFLLINFFNL